MNLVDLCHFDFTAKMLIKTTINDINKCLSVCMPLAIKVLHLSDLLRPPPFYIFTLHGGDQV